MLTQTPKLDDLFVRVAKIVTYGSGQRLTNATGFFYKRESFLYLITAAHVVTGAGTDSRPDTLRVTLHTNETDLQQSAELSIPLYVGGMSQFWQHRGYAGNVDLAAVAVNDRSVLSNHFLATFSAVDIPDIGTPAFGQDVLIVGFPLGFHDTYNKLPIVRRAIIATSFAHPFKGNPYFLTDARLHRGTSGSPVIALLQDETDRVPKWKLLGIHTSALDVSDRDDLLDEKLALNVTWYASLIDELLPDSGM